MPTTTAIGKTGDKKFYSIAKIEMARNLAFIFEGHHLTSMCQHPDGAPAPMNGSAELADSVLKWLETALKAAELRACIRATLPVAHH